MLQASFDLEQVIGPGHVYVPTPAFEGTGWLPRDRSALDFLTGAQLPIARNVEVVCHRSVSTDAALALLEDAGHPRPTRLLQYHDAASYSALLEELFDRRASIVLSHTHPPGTIPKDRLWLPQRLLRRLNNKRNLLEFVPAESAPVRRVVSGAEIRALAPSQLKPPIVLKAAEDVSSGASYAVRICRTAAEVEAAVGDFGRCEAVALEEFLHFEDTWCVQFIVRPDGSVQYVGSAEQVCEPSGAYHGNWVTAEPSWPTSAVTLGEGIAARIAERGYRGFVGIDIGACDDGRLLAFDINCRFTGSAVALAVFPAVASAKCRVGRSTRWSFDGDFERFERILRDAMGRGTFVPLAVYDPRPDAGATRAYASGLLLGHSRDEILSLENEFAAAGLE